MKDYSKSSITRVEGREGAGARVRGVGGYGGGYVCAVVGGWGEGEGTEVARQK